MSLYFEKHTKLLYATKNWNPEMYKYIIKLSMMYGIQLWGIPKKSNI